MKMSSQCTTNLCFVIIPTPLGLYYHAPWSSILLKNKIIKLTHKWYQEDLNLSPFNMTKYSQPLELILFHVITLRINFYKDPFHCIYIK